MRDIEKELDKLYVPAVHVIHLPQKEKESFLMPEHSVYGEITRESVEFIIKMFPSRFSAGNVFYDFGSGQGKLVAHVALKTDVSKAVGIEYSKTRCGLAKELHSRIEFGSVTPEIRNESFYTADFRDATIVYFDSTMFKESEFLSVANRLPSGCMFIYRACGHIKDPDGSFSTPVSYKPSGAAYNFKII